MEGGRGKIVASLKSGEMTLETKPEIYVPRETCRNCQKRGLQDYLSLGEQYLPRFPSIPDPSLPRAPLTLTACAYCGLLQLRHTVQPDLLFRDYWYRSSINDSMRTALQDLVKDAQKYRRHGAWLDIGANDGYLLSCVPAGYTKIACEPATDFHEGLRKVSDQVIPDYFDGKVVGRKCEVITSAAMFYDLDDPHTFLEGISECLADDGVWINQLNDAPGMLKTNAFDSLCHEHLCYYDVWTLAEMYKQHGLKIIDISYNDVNGGSVRLAACKVGTPIPLHGIPKPKPEDVDAFARRVKKWKERMTDLVRGTIAQSKSWCYGASTKGMVLLQYLDCHAAFVGVADKNPKKHGLYMAGSWLPITDEVAMRRDKPQYVMMLPWGFRDEFVERESELRQDGATLLFPLPNPELVL